MTEHLATTFTRRRLLMLAAATAVASACGGDEDSAATTLPTGTATAVAPTSTRNTVRFTDDRGVTVEFERPPARIVAWQAIVPALVELGITPVGVIAFNDLATNPALIDAGVDTSQLFAVSEAYGEVDIEALAALEPDVIVTYTYGEPLLQGFTDDSTRGLAEQVAPFVAFDALADVISGIERFEQFAVVCGADLASAEIAADAAEFDSAVADFEALIAERPGLTVAFGGPTPDGLFVAPVASYPELQFYEALGLDVLSGSEDAVVSWELVEATAADVFMVDDRTTPDELVQANDVATWTVIPAVAAGQVHVGWRFLLSYSRADYARTIRRMLPALTAADASVV